MILLDELNFIAAMHEIRVMIHNPNDHRDAWAMACTLSNRVASLL